MVQRLVQLIAHSFSFPVILHIMDLLLNYRRYQSDTVKL